MGAVFVKFVCERHKLLRDGTRSDKNTHSVIPVKLLRHSQDNASLFVRILRSREHTIELVDAVDELVKEGNGITFVVPAAAAIKKSRHLLGQLGFIQRISPLGNPRGILAHICDEVLDLHQESPRDVCSYALASSRRHGARRFDVVICVFDPSKNLV